MRHEPFSCGQPRPFQPPDRWQITSDPLSLSTQKKQEAPNGGAADWCVVQGKEVDRPKGEKRIAPHLSKLERSESKVSRFLDDYSSIAALRDLSVRGGRRLRCKPRSREPVLDQREMPGTGSSPKRSSDPEGFKVAVSFLVNFGVVDKKAASALRWGAWAAYFTCRPTPLDRNWAKRRSCSTARPRLPHRGARGRWGNVSDTDRAEILRLSRSTIRLLPARVIGVRAENESSSQPR